MTRPYFPALLVAPLLLVLCVFPGQVWLAPALPAWSGRATLTPGLIIFDIPIQLPLPVDLILVPVLFIILYSIAILIFASRNHFPAWPYLTKRLSTFVISLFIVLFCVGLGALLSVLVRNHLPDQVRTSLRSFAVNADLHLTIGGYAHLPLDGDVFALLGLVVGIVLGIRQMKKAPKIRQRAQLTREQRLTPYQRMLQERRTLQPNAPTRPPISRPAIHQPVIDPHTAYQPIPREVPTSSSRTSRTPHYPSHGLCQPEPLLSFQPEAVNFRPLI